jgi:GT2 family glycosyltransferase
MKLSFVIVNYRSEKYLEKCLDSLHGSNISFEYEVIVVHNDNNEAPKINHERVSVLDCKNNLGYAKANNLGAKIAKGEIICFLNPDTLIATDQRTWQQLLETFENEDIAAIGPKLLIDFKNQTPQPWSAGKIITPTSIILNNLGLISSKKVWESSLPVNADWVSGASLFVRKPIFEKLEGFDENFFMYFEDVDLCKRILQLDKKVLYYPQLAIFHHGGKSSSSNQLQKQQYYQSQDYYLSKHFGKSAAKFLSWLRKIFH